MSTVLRPATPPPPEEGALPPLREGERLDRETFHARYEAMPPGTRAELIDGVVYMPSPARLRHGQHHSRVLGWFEHYLINTPGVDAAAEATVFLGKRDEPQPDACLFIKLEHGGQTGVEDGYLTGPPELVAEVALSSADYDTTAKKQRYQNAGVREYLIVLVEEQQVLWYANHEGSFEELVLGQDGLLRSEVFPGLWLDLVALLRLDSAAIRTALERGLASPEHQEFVERLARQGGGGTEG